MAIQQYPQPTPDTGIPSGDTAGRPAAPVIGDQYYNGETLTLEIFDGTDWYPISATPGQYTIVATDVGTGVAFGAAQASVAFTPAYTTGEPLGYVTYATSGGYTSTGTSSPVITTVGNNGNWAFNGLAYNDYGQGPLSNTTTSIALTTVPEAPTIGTATTSETTSDVVVTWTLGNDGGKNLTSITITPYLNGTTAQTSETAATTSSITHTFTSLTGTNSYTFKVKTTNANGDSIESAASNSITVPVIFTANFLVLAGGGGASGSGGGSGAGGYRTSVGTTGGGGATESSLQLASGTNFTVTVGAGGAGSVNISNGSSSTLKNITSTGGGWGGHVNNTRSGQAGGSGGGAAWGTAGASAGAGTAGQGFAGGNKASFSGGGGGGAASVGNAGTDNGGNGGNGITSSITGSSIARAGGGGGIANSIDTNNGGTGTGGGGTANRGGGVNGHGGALAGGSGVVVIVYPSTLSATAAVGLTSTTNTDTSNSTKITTFNAGTGLVSIS
jgi:hypothetical protein